MQHFPVRCAAMTGPLRSSPSAAARLERSSSVVLHATNASNRRIRASLPISSVLLPDPTRAGDFSIWAMAEPEGGKFPVTVSARKAIMEKRPNEYSNLQPEDGCALSDCNVTPPRGSRLTAPAGGYRVVAECAEVAVGCSPRRGRLMIVVRILPRRPDGSALECVSPPRSATGIARLRTSSITSPSSSP